MSKKIDLELLAKTVKAILGQDKNIKELNGRDTIAVNENDIVIYQSEDNQFYFYKAVKNGNISIPTEEYCEKLVLTSETFFWKIFKKKMNSHV